MAVNGGPGGSSSLASLIAQVRSEADIENDPHITDSELTTWINKSRYALYDILIQRFGDDYYTAQSGPFALNAGQNLYPLPDGVLYDAAPAFYKGLLVEATRGPTVVPNQPITLTPFNLREKNRYNLPQTLAIVPFMLPRYRLSGSNILFAPTPISSGIWVNLWYAPRLAELVALEDVAEDFSGWLELVVIDATIKALAKQERDAQVQILRRNEIKDRIERAADHRNLGDPATVVETMQENSYGYPGGGSFGMGGPWS